MAMDRAIVAWTATDIPEGFAAPTPRPGRAALRLTVGFVRTGVLVGLASLAILVLLPAALAAQAAVGV